MTVTNAPLNTCQCSKRQWIYYWLFTLCQAGSLQTQVLWYNLTSQVFILPYEKLTWVMKIDVKLLYWKCQLKCPLWTINKGGQEGSGQQEGGTYITLQLGVDPRVKIICDVESGFQESLYSSQDSSSSLPLTNLSHSHYIARSLPSGIEINTDVMPWWRQLYWCGKMMSSYISCAQWEWDMLIWLRLRLSAAGDEVLRATCWQAGTIHSSAVQLTLCQRWTFQGLAVGDRD